jgi:hypothetical protein
VADPSRSERLSSAFKRLAATTKDLKAASDEFTKPISKIEQVLEPLQIRFATWQKLAGGEDNYGGYWSRDVGYAKVEGKWGLAIRTVNGNHHWDEDQIEMWRFHEAPSSMRIQALDQLPDLLEEIIKNAEKTSKKLREMTPEAQELASALTAAVEEMKPQKKERR